MILDEFMVAHTVGWWAKALMLRHSGMCALPAWPGAHPFATALTTQAAGCGLALCCLSLQSSRFRRVCPCCLPHIKEKLTKKSSLLANSLASPALAAKLQ